MTALESMAAPAPARATSAGAAGKRALVSLAIAAILGAQGWAVGAGYEDWPIGANAMFAFDLGGDALYGLDFYAELSDGTVRRIDPEHDLGMPEMMFKRQFFAKYYWSTNDRYPQGWHGADSPQAFQGRVADWCQRVGRVLARRGVQARAIQLQATRMDMSLNVMEKKTVARVPLEPSSFERGARTTERPDLGDSGSGRAL